LRPSHGVSAYMQLHGYRIVPVNPLITEALGENSYPSLLDVPDKIDLVDVFAAGICGRDRGAGDPLKIPAIWMQEDVINERAAEKARKAGMFVVMDRCVLKEHRARFG